MASLPPPGARPMDVEERARVSRGASNAAIYRMVARTVHDRHPGGGTLVDVGCGAGNMWPFVHDRFDRYLGLDVVRYDDFPAEGQFHQIDLDTRRATLPDGVGDVVAAVETIEHLENPRAFVRELVRLTRPGGLILVTTPNQLSLLSKLTLVLKNQFNAFQEGPGLYPAHLTALLECDLLRIAGECELVDAAIRYSDSGRIPGTARHWPRPLRGRLFSDNVLLEARC